MGDPQRIRRPGWLALGMFTVRENPFCLIEVMLLMIYIKSKTGLTNMGRLRKHTHCIDVLALLS